MGEEPNQPFHLSCYSSWKVGFQRSRAVWRNLVVLLIIGAALGLLVVSNVAGWRARVLARLLGTESRPVMVAPPASFQPKVPLGFRVSVFARGFTQPRWMAVAPDGDVFVADSEAGEVVALHAAAGQPVAESCEIFADHLNLPFGIAFHDNYVYVADTDELLRFHYDSRTSKRLSDPERILELPGRGYNQHWTRSLAFSPDGKQMFVSVGSKTKVSIESDPRRSTILAADSDGSIMRIYAAGLRNAVGIGFNAASADLWATVNERDDIGDDVPSDYFTHVIEGGFYGWPYSYIGQHLDNRVPPRLGLVAKAIVPDVLLGATWGPCSLCSTRDTNFLLCTAAEPLLPSMARGIVAVTADTKSSLSRCGQAFPQENQCHSSRDLCLTRQARFFMAARRVWRSHRMALC